MRFLVALDHAGEIRAGLILFTPHQVAALRRPRTEARTGDWMTQEGLTHRGPLQKGARRVRGVALIRFTCHTAMRNRPRHSSAPRLALVFPAWPAGFCPLGKAEGAERRLALQQGVHACGVSPPTCACPSFWEGNAAPLGAPHGVGRPAGSRFRLTARFQHLRWAWPSPGSERIAWRRCAPGRIPEPLGPRACKARRRRRRTPLRCQMPPERPRVSGVGGRYDWGSSSAQLAEPAIL